MKTKGLKHIDFILFDVICLVISFVGAYLIKFGWINPFNHSEWRVFALLLVIIDLLVMMMGGVFSGILGRGYGKEIFAIIKQTIWVFVIMALYLFVTQSGVNYSRIVVGLTAVLYMVLTWILRSVWKKYLNGRINQNIRRMVVIGTGKLAERFLSEAGKDHHNSILERFEDHDTAGLEEFLKSDESGKRLEVVAALPGESEDMIPEIVNLCEKYGVRVDVIPFYADIMSSKASVEQFGDVKLLNFRTTPLDELSNAMIKRLFDIAASLFFIILTSPVMLIAAVGTKLSGVKSIIFKQERVGRNRKVFNMYKFRSMRDIGDGDTAWTTDDDARKTKFGAFLRKFSIDEFPQFFNVLFGQMSLIGPRPEIPHHVEHFIEEIPLYQVRLQVRPGITGWAQVNGLRGDTSIEERIKYDIWYIENWSLSLEIKIIFKTVFGGMINNEKI